MSDTRPDLTARWRELERKGWMFRLDGLILCASKGNKTLLGRVRVPSNEAQELEYINKVLEADSHD